MAGLLKEFASASLNPRVRSSSVFWLGQRGGEIPFLTSLARNEHEDSKLRRTAIHAIGASRDKDALAALRELYATNLPSDLRRGIIHAVADNADKTAAYDFC
ncbi:MAG: HEAT repeat domain-containing protein [Pyrinomonadaceae bacterium]